MLFVSASPDLDHHDTGPYHPERPERVAAALDGIEAAGLTDAVVRLPPRQATKEEARAVFIRSSLPPDDRGLLRGGRRLARLRYSRQPGFMGYRVARSRRGPGSSGRSHCFSRRRRFCGSSATGPPRNIRSGDGFLPTEQCRDRRRGSPGPRRAGAGAGLGRAPRERDGGDFLGRTGLVLRLDPPVAPLPRHRRPSSDRRCKCPRDEHEHPIAPRCHGRRVAICVRRNGGTRGFRFRPDLGADLVGLRRPCGRTLSPIWS